MVSVFLNKSACLFKHLLSKTWMSYSPESALCGILTLHLYIIQWCVIHGLLWWRKNRTIFGRVKKSRWLFLEIFKKFHWFRAETSYQYHLRKNNCFVIVTFQAVHVADYHKRFLVSAHYPSIDFDSHVTVRPPARPPHNSSVPQEINVNCNTEPQITHSCYGQ